MPSLNHNIDRTHGFETLRVEGEVPDALRGTLYRVGPGLVRRFGKEVHPFLADGLITAVSIDEAPAGACDLVRTPEFEAEEVVGHSLYDPNANGLRRLANGLLRKVKNTGNTNVLAWRGALYALMEQGHPVGFDGATLATLGATDMGVIRGSFSAHPHRVEALRTTFNFGVLGRRVYVYALPDDGPARRLCDFEAPWAGIIHDFIVTERHAIFFIDPGKLVAWRAILGLKDFSKYFHWDNSESTRAIAIPLAEPENRFHVEVDPFRVWHFANAYEDGDEIVVDAFRHDNIDVLVAPTTANDEIPSPQLFRYRISRKCKTMGGERLSPAVAEFPSVNPRLVGQRHRHVWMQTYRDGAGNEGIGRFDTETGTQMRYVAPDGHLGSEPMFVPGGADETDGWVLQLVQDSTARQSYLAIFGGKSFQDGPVARLWFDHAIPATFHGTFVPLE